MAFANQILQILQPLGLQLLLVGDSRHSILLPQRWNLNNSTIET
jgi:hypothetical protein